MRGVKIAVRGEASFFVHFFAAAAVVLAAGILECSRWQWCILMLCITVVFTAEAFNTALEQLARSLHPERHPGIRDALDMAAGAVLLASIGAALAGAMVFLR